MGRQASHAATAKTCAVYFRELRSDRSRHEGRRTDVHAVTRGVLRGSCAPSDKDPRACACGPAPMSGPRRSLRTELLVNLGFVTSAAVILVGLTTVVLAGGELDATLRPLGCLSSEAPGSCSCCSARTSSAGGNRAASTALGGGQDLLAPRPPRAARRANQSRELAHLSSRYRAMAESLLDAQSQVVRVESSAGIGDLAAGWHTRSGTRWGRSARTWTSCATAEAHGGHRCDARRHRADRANGAEACSPTRSRGRAGATI